MNDVFEKLVSIIESDPSLAGGKHVSGWTLACVVGAITLEVRTIELSEEGGFSTKKLVFDTDRNMEILRSIGARGLTLGGVHVASITMHVNVDDVWRCEISGFGIPSINEETRPFFESLLEIFKNNRSKFVESDDAPQAA